MQRPLDKISIQGFKSIRELTNFELNACNVLIGANGVGKSNFIEVFRMLRAMLSQQLQAYVLKQGSADGFLFNGPKVTSQIKAVFTFRDNAYRFALEPTVDGRLLIANEDQKYKENAWEPIAQANMESRLLEVKDKPGSFHSPVGVGYYTYEAIRGWMVYHFHDTSNTAYMRRWHDVHDHMKLRGDASNIASVLSAMQLSNSRLYEDIVSIVRLAIPFFDEFLLSTQEIPDTCGKQVKLDWRQQGTDYPMQPYHFSDGSIRFICLVVALMQPQLPSTIVIDEPELGLHPNAIHLLSELTHAASERTQVIVSTQSPALVDCFEPDDIVVVNRDDKASVFQRLDSRALQGWLEEYSLGELWRKNVIAGVSMHV